MDRVPRVVLATLPTPLERGPELPGGARLWVKRDDLTGLGGGGNKARKLEFLCAEALAAGARSLVTVGAAQSNHCRMTAAAGARLGLAVHLVLSGDRPQRLEGNLALAALFGAQFHFVGCPDSHWGELEIAREQLATELAGDGRAPHSIPMGGSTPTGAVAYAAAYAELLDQSDAAGISPRAIVFTSSSGGTHAGLARRTSGGPRTWPRRCAGSVGDRRRQRHRRRKSRHRRRSQGTCSACSMTAGSASTTGDVELDDRWLGDDYAVPSRAGDEAIVWAATHGGWVLDRTYTGKGFSGLLGNAAAGRWGPGDDVVFIHTGGTPAVFTTGGLP